MGNAMQALSSDVFIVNIKLLSLHLTTYRTFSEQLALTFILGDFNDDLFTNDNKITKIIEDHKLTQMIDKSTKVTLTFSTL